MRVNNPALQKKEARKVKTIDLENVGIIGIWLVICGIGLLAVGKNFGNWTVNIIGIILLFFGSLMVIYMIKKDHEKQKTTNNQEINPDNDDLDLY